MPILPIYFSNFGQMGMRIDGGAPLLQHGLTQNFAAQNISWEFRGDCSKTVQFDFQGRLLKIMRTMQLHYLSPLSETTKKSISRKSWWRLPCPLTGP